MPYCELEPGDYPEDEFKETARHGLVHYRGRPHTTLGDYIDLDPAPDADIPLGEENPEV